MMTLKIGKPVLVPHMKIHGGMSTTNFQGLSGKAPAAVPTPPTASAPKAESASRPVSEGKSRPTE